MCNCEGGGIGLCLNWGKTQIRIQYSGYPPELKNLALYVETERDLSSLFFLFHSKFTFKTSWFCLCKVPDSFIIKVRGGVPGMMDLPLICLSVPNPTTATILLYFIKIWRKFEKISTLILKKYKMFYYGTGTARTVPIWQHTFLKATKTGKKGSRSNDYF